MVVKGSSRANPAQLARHLLRTDQNERVEILQCDSSPTHVLREAFADMQLLAAGTKGSKGLYHAQINPDARYELTRDQWERSADILAEELGLTGQPRTVVMHQKKGRPHLHVVWARTDLSSMTLISDSHNYRKHEQASDRMEREFGHDHTPGAHHKRNPDVPRPTAAFNHASWQQFERTKLDPRNLTAALTDLYRSSDNGRAFRAALEHHGYRLAQGKRRAYIVVDPAGNAHSLSRRIEGVRAKDIKERFSDLSPATLPTVEEAQALQKQNDRAPDKPIELPRPLPEFNQAAEQKAKTPKDRPPPDPEQARKWLRNQLETDRSRFLEQMRRENTQQEAYWAKHRQEEMERFSLHLKRKAAAQKKAPPQPPKGLSGVMRHYWDRLQDRIDPGRPQHRIAKAEEKRIARQENLRAKRLRQLAAWEQNQRLAFRKAQAEKLQAQETRYAEEIARLARESARYQKLREEREQSQERVPAKETTPAPATALPAEQPAEQPTEPNLSAPTEALAEARERIAAEHEALKTRHRQEEENAKAEWRAFHRQKMQAFEAALEKRREDERQEEARNARSQFPFIGPAPKTPAPAPKPPRRAVWKFNPARAQERVRQQQAREARRDERDDRQRTEKFNELNRQIAHLRDQVSYRQMRELQQLEDRHAEQLASLERDVQRRDEQSRRDREERQSPSGRDSGFDRDPPLRRRLRTRSGLSRIFHRFARRRSLAVLFNQVASIRKVLGVIRLRPDAQVPPRGGEIHPSKVRGPGAPRL